MPKIHVTFAFFKSVPNLELKTASKHRHLMLCWNLMPNGDSSVFAMDVGGYVNISQRA